MEIAGELPTAAPASESAECWARLPGGLPGAIPPPDDIAHQDGTPQSK